MIYMPSSNEMLVKKLGEVVSDLYMATDERDIKRLWGTAHRLLLKSKAPPERIETVMKQRRPGALSTLVIELQKSEKAPTSLRGPAASTAQVTVGESGLEVGGQRSEVGDQPSGTSDQPSTIGPQGPQPTSQVPRPAPGGGGKSGGGPSHEALKAAMKAFRKRLKLTRLDDESKLGLRAMSGGRKSNVIAIMAPREFPQSVWQELARQGKLKDTGGGFYELVGE
jgi:hypothetical protein